MAVKGRWPSFLPDTVQCSLAHHAPGTVEPVFSTSHMPASWIGLDMMLLYLEQLPARPLRGWRLLPPRSSPQEGLCWLSGVDVCLPGPGTCATALFCQRTSHMLCLLTHSVNSWRQRPCLFYWPMYDQGVVKYPIKCFVESNKKCEWLNSEFKSSPNVKGLCFYVTFFIIFWICWICTWAQICHLLFHSTNTDWAQC